MTGIERLREWADGYAELGKDHTTIDVVPSGMATLLSSMADQIEREHTEDREAIAWVRERGGLERVKAQRRESMPRAAYERKKAGFLGHIAECETALGRRREIISELGRTIEFFQLNNSNFRHLLADVADRLGFTRYGDDYEPEDLIDALDRRLMPEGVERDGSVLRIRTAENVDYDGETLFVLIGGRDE